MNAESKPIATLIISVYDNIPFLRTVLYSINEQTLEDFEIIISEDGEHQEMADFLNGFPFKHPWTHLRQEDLGWRKNRALNRAIQSAHTEYLVFIDGDCVLHPRFMEMHVELSKEGQILGGKRFKMNEELTQPFLQGSATKNEALIYITKNLGRLRQSGVRFPEEAFFFKYNSLLGSLARFRKIHDLKGCNMSFFKNDILSINGFDEDYIHPAIGEDIDLAWRFKRAGFTLKSVRNFAVQYHLYHKESWSDQEENLHLMKQKQLQNQIFCKNGIQKSS